LRRGSAREYTNEPLFDPVSAGERRSWWCDEENDLAVDRTHMDLRRWLERRYQHTGA
jgi:hypothetical protein